MLLALALVSPACGGDDGSGVDPDKTFDQVSAGEANDICEWVADLVSESDAKQVACYLVGIVTEQLGGGDCDQVADACLADTTPAQAGCSVTTQELPECASTVTVGEVETCLEDVASQIASLADTISCDSSLAELEDPASCVAIDEKCPDLLEDPE
jgi:hypothetical protein